MNIHRQIDSDTTEYIQALAEYSLAHSILPVVGAGLSRDFEYPLWKDFLLQEASRYGISDIHGMLDQGEYEKAADKIYQISQGKLEEDIAATFGNENRINDIFQQKFAGRDPLTDVSMPAVMVLPWLTNGPVLTFNFDPVLKVAYERAGRPFLRIFSGAQQEDIAASIGTGQRILLKLHGNADEKITRILTGQEYAHHYLIENQQTIDYAKRLPMALRYAFGKRILVFMGCSLRSDRYLNVLIDTQNFFGNKDIHFAIVEKPDNFHDKQYRTKHLLRHGIHPIWYNRGDHQFVTWLLQTLCNKVQSNNNETHSQSENKTNVAVDRTLTVQDSSVKPTISGQHAPKFERIYTTNILVKNDQPISLLDHVGPIDLKREFSGLRPGLSGGFVKRLIIFWSGSAIHLRSFPWLILIRANENAQVTGEVSMILEKSSIPGKYLYYPNGRDNHLCYEVTLKNTEENRLQIDIHQKDSHAALLQFNLHRT